MKDKNRIIKSIKFYSFVRRFLSLFCIILILGTIAALLIFGIYFGHDSLQFIAKFKDKKDLQIEKIMINPNIKFENQKNDYYTVKASKAIHQTGNDILLFDVVADGSAINIKAGKVAITNDGNDLTFSDNPVLIIKQNPKNISKPNNKNIK